MNWRKRNIRREFPDVARELVRFGARRLSARQLRWIWSKAFLSSKAWKSVRYDVLRRDGGRCRACGRPATNGAMVNVDHIKPRRFYPELAFTKSNLQVLCADCNHGKGHRDQTDWR